MRVSSPVENYQRNSISAAKRALVAASDVEGKSLTSIIKQQGTLSEKTVIFILIQLLRELKQYHDRGLLIDSGIEPDNIIWRPGNRVSLCLNFCPPKEASSHSQKTYDNLKESEFSAPEQAWGEAGFSSNLYALGLTAIYLLTGKLPKQFPSDPQMGTILWYADARQISPRLGLILDKAIQPLASDRYCSAQEMLAALEHLLHLQTRPKLKHSHRQTSSLSFATWTRRAISFSIFLLALTVPSLVYLYQRQPKQQPPTPEISSRTPTETTPKPPPSLSREKLSQTTGSELKNPVPSENQRSPAPNPHPQTSANPSQSPQSQTTVPTPQPSLTYAPSPPITQYIDIKLDNKSYWQSQMPSSSVVLTFDDGPSTEYTPQILGILSKNRVKATFFVIGKRVEQHCGLILQIVSQGHELGNHSYSHSFLWKNGEFFQRQEIKKGLQAIEKCIPGYHPNWFRAPYAAQDEATFNASHNLGLHTTMWTVDTNDWRKTSTVQSIKNQIISTQGRDIILMHDGTEANLSFQHPEASASRQNTVDALDEAITSLKQRGLRFMTLSEAFSAQNQ